ncbi:hypothetical protein GCM10023340_31720 [Nocardioides marinquilinus]|uniref:Secreted protein n=1 Tax=Nocardioides marinquilinus TaxID=1210400 RepID=A0ABP9PW83_9ACTN
MRSLTRLAAAAALAGLTLLPAVGAPAGAVEPSASGTTVVTGAATGTATYGVPESQKITFAVDGCDRCGITLAAYDGQRSWSSRSKQVGPDHRVTFTVPQRWVDGVSAAISSPWEKRLGYVSQVVFRYGGEKTGDRVTVAEARTKRKGSLCLASDPSQVRSTVPLTVRKVRVEGVGGRTDGTLAFATRTQRPAPMTRIFGGVGGAQDVPPCQG